MNLTDAQLSLLRSQPHRTNLWLSIYRPDTLMTAQVTGTYATGDRQISFFNVSGSYLNLYPDLTVKIGSAPGDEDVGRLRIRGVTGTYVDVAENAVNWNTGMYLTFVDYIDVQAVYPRIIQDPNNAENVIFYKDYDVPYSNQNSIYGTFPCAGPHRATFLSSGTATVYYTATGTYNVASSALSYLWTFDGGTPTGSTALTPGNVTYSQPGYYKTRLRVTAANGAVDYTYRYVSVYDRPGEGSSTPTLQWELQELSGSRDEGGYTAGFKLYENIGEVEPNALVVIFADTWYGGTKAGIGGNAQQASNIVFVGYILSDTIKFDYKSSSVEFKVGSVSEVMKRAEGFSVSCESKASPVTWFELQEMTVPKAMYHYLRWHSTVLKTTDFQYTGDDRLVQYFDADRGSLFDAVDSFMRDGMLGSVVADRQGKLWAEISSFGLQTPFSTIPTRFTFHKQDWIGAPFIDERRVSDLSFVELGGIIYYGIGTNLFLAVLANAPSTVPLYQGKSERNDGLILLSQQQLNQVSGNYLAHFNTRFPNVSLSLAGAYLNLDIAPLEKNYLVISSEDSVRGKSIQNLPYIVNDMEWSYDSRDEVFRPDINLLQIATGTVGVTVEIPEVPPDGGYGYPEIELPPLPVFPATGNQIPGSTSRSLLIHDGDSGIIYTGKGILYTLDFDSSSPTWQTMNSGLTSAQFRAVNNIIITPSGVVYAAYEGRWTRGAADGHFIARAPALGGTFTILKTESDIESEYAGSGDELILEGMSCRTDVSETVLFLAGRSIPPFGDTCDVGVYLGSSTSFSKTATITDLRITARSHGRSSTSFGQNTWALIYDTVVGISQQVKYHRYNSGATASSLTATVGSNTCLQVRGGTTGVIYVTQDASSTKFYFSNDNGSTWQALPDSDDMFGGAAGLDCDDTGQYVMAPWTDAGRRGKSTDYGTTWSGIPNLPYEGRRLFGYLGGTGAAGQWVAVGSTTVRYSPDFGNTWLNKEGNISTILGTGFMDIVVPVP